MKRPREPRPKLPTELPLDDGPREGTDPWREVDGIRFCSGVETFLRSLPEHQADLAMRELAKILTELRGAGLDDQLGKARGLRRAVVAAADAFAESTEAGARKASRLAPAETRQKP